MNRRLNIYAFVGLIVLLVLMILFFTSCYTEKKANQQHGKAVATFPKIGADYCARTYPCLPGEVKSDTVIVTDTLWGALPVEIYSDTVRVNDTVRIVKTVQSPSKIITRTVTIKDTIQIQDKAALDKSEIERKSETGRANKEQSEKEKYRSSRNSWRTKAIATWSILGLIAGVYIFLFIKRKQSGK